MKYVATHYAGCVAHGAVNSLGWDIRGAAHLLWRGERDPERLAGGKDPGTSRAIRRLLFHARKFDDQRGKKVIAF